MNAPSNHKARKRFGQNFLHDPFVIDNIVRAVNPQPGQHLVEIGPGQGAITLPLLRECEKLEVIEFDRDLIGPLAQLAEGVGELKIHQHDILKFDFTNWHPIETCVSLATCPTISPHLCSSTYWKMLP